MCNFFSGVVTPQGIWWCEVWSHGETIYRLRYPVEFVNIEYDPERGLEVHEPLRFPAWFDVSAVAIRAMKLYEQLEPLARAYDKEREQMEKEYRKQINLLADFYDEKLRALNTVCDKKIEEFEKIHPEPLEKLSDELREQRHEIFTDYEKKYIEIDDQHFNERKRVYKNYTESCKKLNELYREQFSAFEGYVPPRKDEEVR
jgi:hypothetical protein